MSEVVIVGGCNMDLIVRTSHLPRPGETVLGGGFFTAPGGKGSNQAVAAARLRARVAFVGRVGDDDFGARLRRMLEDEGISVDSLAIDADEPTGVAQITVDERGENTIVVASGANSRLSERDVEAAAPAIRRARTVLLQLESPLPALVRASEIAVSADVPVVLSIGPAREVPPELLRRTAVLIANRREIGQMVGLNAPDLAAVERAARAMLQRGVGAAAVTLGARGALAVDRDGARSVLGFPVRAVDTTGAGDAFCAGFSVALSRDRSLEYAARMGNACGALAATRPGAQPSMPRKDEVDVLLGLSFG